MKTPTASYPLIDSQKMVQYMWKYALHKAAAQIPCAVILNEALDLRCLARAVNVEIERNDCLRLRFARTKAGVRQYFAEEYKLEKIPVRVFGSEAEQNNALTAEAGKALRVFKGETLRLLFFTDGQGHTGIFLSVSHLIMDAAATFLFFKDLLAVYGHLKDGKPLPKPLTRYEDLIKRELEDGDWAAHTAREAETLADWVKRDGPPVYCSLKPADAAPKGFGRHSPGPLSPKDFFPLTDKIELTRLSLSPEDSALLRQFTAERQLSPEWAVQLGLRAALARRSGRGDTLFWVLCPRRRTVKEKRAGGTLASPMPWREILPGELTFEAALRQLGTTQSFLFRHADMPFSALRENERRLFGYNALQTCSSMMFSFLPLTEGAPDARPFAFSGYSMGHYVMPLYTVTLIDPQSGLCKFLYYHRTCTYTAEDVRAFHADAARVIALGLRAPDKTINRILEEL